MQMVCKAKQAAVCFWSSVMIDLMYDGTIRGFTKLKAFWSSGSHAENLDADKL